jgi:hypothetical protein
MYRPRINAFARASARSAARPVAASMAALVLGTALAGCSDIYYDRRDTVSLSGGDAVAANEAAQMIDPWPRQSGNTNIATNGQRMQSAIERYRTNIVTQPVDPMMLQIANQTPATAQSNTNSNSNPVPSIGSGSTTTTTTVVTSAPSASPSQ